jgi:hypothetical protein
MKTDEQLKAIALKADKTNTYLELGSLGIVGGDDKRALENYVSPAYFRQRKTYDEYYIDVTNIQIALNFKDLTILAENFIVRVLEDGHVVLSN